MKFSLHRTLLATTTSLAVLAGCESSSMDRDLKRDADRKTLQLDRIQAERDSLRDAADKANAAITVERARADRASKEAEDLRRRLAQSDADVLQARQKIRELEEAALAARQGMPATRQVQP